MTQHAPSDPITRLAAAGLLNAKRPLAAARRRVLAALSPEEVDTLIGNQQQIGDAADAQGHGHDSRGDRVLAIFGVF